MLLANHRITGKSLSPRLLIGVLQEGLVELLILLLLFPNDLASHLSCNGRNPHGAKRSANGGGPSLEV